MATSKRPDWASTMAKRYYFFLYFDISTVTSSDNKDIKSQNGDAVISNVVVFQTTITKTNRLTTYEIQNTCPQKWPGIAVKRLKHVFWRWLPIPALILKMIKYTTNACGSDEMLSLPPRPSNGGREWDEIDVCTLYIKPNFIWGISSRLRFSSSKIALRLPIEN